MGRKQERKEGRVRGETKGRKESLEYKERRKKRWKAWNGEGEIKERRDKGR